MTETLLDPPPSPPPPPPRLARDPDEKVVAGVCAGLARYTSTDPVLWRVAVAALAVFGGAGFVLYALAWLLLPRVDQQESAAERLLRRPGSGLSVAGVVVLVLAAVVVLGISFDGGPGLGVLLVLGGLAYLVLRERRETPPVYGPAPLATASYGPSAWSDGGAPPPVVRAPRERSVLGTLTLSVTVLVTGVLLALRENGVESLTVARVLAVALLIVGAGLVLGTWWGRARWLALVGLVLAGLLVPAALLEGSPGSLRGGVGERPWVPADAVARDRSYELGAGEAVLDLRQLEPGSARRVIDAEVGVGQLVVLVPEDLVVQVSAEVGLGEIVVRELDGSRVDRGDEDGTGLDEEFIVGSPARDANVALDLQVGAGEIEVRRVTS
ncbi:MAG: PspC domain-containing protein [Frankiaceae bacterium]|nr:PspC domain-containing protein [Frankiaceae bacterium]